MGLAEGRGERINIGILGSGLTVIFFHFANMLDKLGRSVRLMALGLPSLIGGYLLDLTRRRLIPKRPGFSP